MASSLARKYYRLRSSLTLLRPATPCITTTATTSQRACISSSIYSWTLPESSCLSPPNPFSAAASRSFCSKLVDESQVPAPIDYSSVLQEDEFHKLADSTIHDLLERLEEYGDSVDIDGFDIDYGNEVLTVRLGILGTYVVNKQTPNRQIWLSSPESGPSRFDWDPNTQTWVYRRNKTNLFKLLEAELEQLCGKPVHFS